MRVAWAIARKDLRELVRDSRLLCAALIVGVILTVASVAAAQRTARATAERAAAQQAERDRWLEQGDANPHAAAHYGTFVFAPVNALAQLDPGVTAHLPSAIFLEAHRQQLAHHRPVEDALTFRRLGDLSVAGCLQTVVPLFLILIAAVAIAREGDRGTWALLRTSGASVRAIVAGKGLASTIGLAAVLLPALMVAVGFSLWTAALPLDRDDVARVVLLVAAYAVYLGTWLGLALALSVQSTTAQQALATGMALWLATCVVTPPALMTLAALWTPAPSVATFTAALDDERAKRPTWDDRVAAATDRFLNGEELPVASNPEVVALIDTEADDTELYGRHLAALAARLEQQERTYRSLAWLTPAAAMQVTSMTLAGTDYAHHRHFERAAADYRTTLLRSLNDDLAAFDSWKTFNASGSRALWARIPEFDYTTPDVRWALRQLAGAMVGLLLWFSVAIVWLRRGRLARP